VRVEPLDPGPAQRLDQAGVERAKQLTESERTRLTCALESAQGGPCHPDWAGLMSWEQVRELHRLGHEVGSHSMTHPLLPGCTAQQIRDEIHRSRERLQQETGAPVASFCYPNGSYDARCLSEVQAAGYECSVTTRWGLNRRDAQPHELLRCDMDVARLFHHRQSLQLEVCKVSCQTLAECQLFY